MFLGLSPFLGNSGTRGPRAINLEDGRAAAPDTVGHEENLEHHGVQSRAASDATATDRLLHIR